MSTHSTSRKTSGPIRSSSVHSNYRPSPASTASLLGLDSKVPHAGSGSFASPTPRIPQQAEPPQRKQTVRLTALTTAPALVQTRADSWARRRQTEIGFSPMTSLLWTKLKVPLSQSPLYAPQTRPQPQVQTQPPQTSSAAIFTHDVVIHSTSPPICTTLNLPTSSVLTENFRETKCSDQNCDFLFQPCAGGVFLYFLALLNLVLGPVAMEIKLKLKILQAEHRQVQVSTRIYENKGLVWIAAEDYSGVFHY